MSPITTQPSDNCIKAFACPAKTVGVGVLADWLNDALETFPTPPTGLQSESARSAMTTRGQELVLGYQNRSFRPEEEGESHHTLQVGGTARR